MLVFRKYVVRTKWTMLEEIQKRPKRLLNVLCTFNLRPVTNGDDALLMMMMNDDDDDDEKF